MDQNHQLKKLRRSELEDQFQALIIAFNEYQERLIVEKRKYSFLESVAYEEDYDEIINRFFADLPIKESSSVRLVFKSSDYLLQKICFSNGKYKKDFALLDDQIMEQIGEKKYLVIPDTSRIHNIRFFQGYSYPRSIIVFPITQKNKTIGIVWFGDLNYQAFSKQDFELYEKTIGLYQNALAILVNKKIIKQEKLIHQQIIRNDECPLLVFNANSKIAYANNSAIIAFHLVKNENGMGFTCDIDFSEIIKKQKQSDRIILSYNGKEYEAIVTNSIKHLPDQVYCCRFIDKSLERAKSSYLETIISTITQYLRSPMIEINGLTSLIANLGNLSAKQMDFINQIKFNIKEIENDLAQLLDVNKIRQGSFIELTHFSVEGILAEIIELFIPLTEQKQITININIKEKEAYITNDKILFKHALLNIIDYAIKETQMGGTIEIDYQSNANTQLITVSDSGKGISKLDVKKMMEGNGMGPKKDELELSRRIMWVLSGDLAIESNLGSGTTITLQFPKIG